MTRRSIRSRIFLPSAAVTRASQTPRTGRDADAALSQTRNAASATGSVVPCANTSFGLDKAAHRVTDEIEQRQQFAGADLGRFRDWSGRASPPVLRAWPSGFGPARGGGIVMVARLDPARARWRFPRASRTARWSSDSPSGIRRPGMPPAGATRRSRTSTMFSPGAMRPKR